MPIQTPAVVANELPEAKTLRLRRDRFGGPPVSISTRHAVDSTRCSDAIVHWDLENIPFPSWIDDNGERLDGRCVVTYVRQSIRRLLGMSTTSIVTLRLYDRMGAMYPLDSMMAEILLAGSVVNCRTMDM